MELPTKLKITKARVKNFLSYGNEWQEINFKQGLTLVQGFNVDTEKSNGSGKSSITEIIPFALFGKTIKDLPQAKIVNWNNRSGCEVQLYISVGDKSYIFKRGLKPNKFKVTCDGLDVVRPADIRAFQMQMEEEIIGMDFKTFKNLIYFSPNNTISILGAGKEQKRLFLESLFDLSEYSELLKAANKKIQFFSERVVKTEGLKSTATSLIVKENKDLESFVEISVSQAERQLNTDLSKLAIMVSSQKDIPPVDRIAYEALKGHLKTLEEFQLTLGNSIVEAKARIEYLQTDINNTDLTDLEAKVLEVSNGINTLEKTITDNSDKVSLYTEELSDIRDSMEVVKKDIQDKTLLITDGEQAIALKNQLIDTCRKAIVKFENADTLDGQSECPMCKSSIDHDHVASWYIKAASDEYDHIKNYEEDIAKLLEGISVTKETIEGLKVRGKELAEDFKAKQSVISGNTNDVTALQALRTNLSMLPNIDALKADLSKKKSELEELKKSLSDTEWKHSMNSEDIDGKAKQLADIDSNIKKISDVQMEVDTLTNSVQVSRSTLENLVKIKKAQEIQIEAKKKDIDKYTQDIVLYDNDIRKFNIMLDHLNYMRASLKDENVKQFAISALLPYLNHRANHYLSESGFPYMITIDGWLEVVIRGMGTEDVGYNSLSGGESKAMDMAVQLACNDIAELQAKTSLNISIYDEILDTSLDADGVQKLMNIVRVKQAETNGCVLCITHRDEIKELEFDNGIMIYKQNGFSSIQSQ
jgi:DNA repair exonuclease SbcCD ATPase subunit